MADLTTRAEVLQIAYGRSSGVDFSGSDIDQAISDAQNSIFAAYGDSVHTDFNIINSRRQYEFKKDRVETHEIKFVFVSNPFTSTNSEINRNEVVTASYTADLTTNKLTFTASQIAGWNASVIQVEHIPKMWNLLAKNKAALGILDATAIQINPGEGRTENPRVTLIRRRIEDIESIMQPHEAVGSFENRTFDSRDIDLLEQRRFNKLP